MYVSRGRGINTSRSLVLPVFSYTQKVMAYTDEDKDEKSDETVSDSLLDALSDDDEVFLRDEDEDIDPLEADEESDEDTEEPDYDKM